MTLSVVVLAYNRRDVLRTALTETLRELTQLSRAEIIVVDNASSDGTTEMLADEFPDVRVIRRSVNIGVSGWNDGFAAATGEYVLALDDDCFLPVGGVSRALAIAEDHGADIVSFGIVSAEDPSYRFDLAEFRSGLLSFWGCAALIRREVLDVLGGFDPEIFIHAHEQAFMLRFFDRGFLHLHLPEVVAVHMKTPARDAVAGISPSAYRMIYRNFGYTAAKLLRGRDALVAALNLALRILFDARSHGPVVLRALLSLASGIADGGRAREPVRASVSRVYRRNMWHFVNPLSQVGRGDGWYAERPRYYPAGQGELRL